MQLAIIGAGSVGRALAHSFPAHEITFGVRDPAAKGDLAEGGRYGVTTVGDAVAACDAAVLAVPYHALDDAVTSAGGFAGRVVVDATNPIGPGIEYAEHEYPSGAERLAALAPEARVVKAFNTVGANVYGDADFDGVRATGFHCGDDPAAKALASGLLGDAGFDPLDCGPLAQARYLEHLALLWVRLALQVGHGRDTAFAYLRR